MAVSHHIETQTGWSIKKLVRTARCYRTITIQAGNHTLTAADRHDPASFQTPRHFLRLHA